MKRSIRSAFTGLEILVALGLVALGTFAVVEVRKAFAPDTHKKEIVAVDTQAQTLATNAAAAKEASAKDIADNKTAIATLKVQVDALNVVSQDAAGFLAGGIIALSGETNSTVGVTVAKKLLDDAAKTLPAATSAQVAAFTAIVAEMKAENGRLSAALVVKEKEAEDAKALASKRAVDVQEANDRADASDDAAMVAVTNTAVQAKTHAAAVAVLDGKVAENLTFLQRIKALGVGTGAMLLCLFVFVPLVGLAFPELLPALKGICAPFLKLWQMIHAKELAIVAKLHADAVADAAAKAAALAQETASHEITRQNLLTLAVTPDLPAPVVIATSTTT